MIDRIINDKVPLPPPGATDEEGAILLQDEAYIDSPIKIDYGFNARCIYTSSSLRDASKLIVTDLANAFKISNQLSLHLHRHLSDHNRSSHSSRLKLFLLL
jgi:hypothetical protein